MLESKDTKEQLYYMAMALRSIVYHSKDKTTDDKSEMAKLVNMAKYVDKNDGNSKTEITKNDQKWQGKN